MKLALALTNPAGQCVEIPVLLVGVELRVEEEQVLPVVALAEPLLVTHVQISTRTDDE